MFIKHYRITPYHDGQPETVMLTSKGSCGIFVHGVCVLLKREEAAQILRNSRRTEKPIKRFR